MRLQNGDRSTDMEKDQKKLAYVPLVSLNHIGSADGS